MGLSLQTNAGQFGVGDPVAYGNVWRQAPCQGPGRERISPLEQELGIHLLGGETLDVKQPFGDTVADLGKGVPKPVRVGKRRNQSQKKPLGASMSVYGLAKHDCC